LRRYDEEGAEARRAVAAKVEELGGWDAVQRDPAELAAVAKLMGGEAQMLSTEMEHGFEVGRCRLTLSNPR
jgi:hypothetical protein